MRFEASSQAKAHIKTQINGNITLFIPKTTLSLQDMWDTRRVLAVYFYLEVASVLTSL